MGGAGANSTSNPMKNGLRLITGCVGLAVALGICVDLVTAHVAVEYFTVHHPKVIESKEPLAMALLWGIGASWWFGLAAGVILAVVNARLRPPVPTGRALAAVARACLVMWLTMMAILALVYGLSGLIPEDVRRSSFESDRRLMGVALAHLTEYFLGAVALVILGFRLSLLSRRASTSGRSVG